MAEYYCRDTLNLKNFTPLPVFRSNQAVPRKVNCKLLWLNINWVNTGKQIGCHAPLISDYSSASKCLLASECDIALGQYCTVTT